MKVVVLARLHLLMVELQVVILSHQHMKVLVLETLTRFLVVNLVVVVADHHRPMKAANKEFLVELDHLSHPIKATNNNQEAAHSMVNHHQPQHPPIKAASNKDSLHHTVEQEWDHHHTLDKKDHLSVEQLTPHPTVGLVNKEAVVAEMRQVVLLRSYKDQLPLVR
jgi:hypothetical protein